MRLQRFAIEISHKRQSHECRRMDRRKCCNCYVVLNQFGGGHVSLNTIIKYFTQNEITFVHLCF